MKEVEEKPQVSSWKCGGGGRAVAGAEEHHVEIEHAK